MRKRTYACLTLATLVQPALAIAAEPQAAQPVAFQYDDYYRQGDEFKVSTPIAAQPQATFISNTTNESSAGGAYCGDSCCEDPCCEEVGCGDGCGGGLCSGGCLGGVEGLSLASMIGAEDSGLDIGGWVEGVYMDNNVPLSQAYGDRLSFDDVPDHFHNGQSWLYLGKVADGSCGLGLGGRIDVVYGTDAQKTQAFGNPGAGTPGFGTFDASLDHGVYGWAIPQAYGELASGDLSVKVGHFFTPLGYEVIPVTGNFFRSHSYTMFNSEPFTHTGALGTYTGFEGLTLYGGWSAGWDTGFDQLNGGSNLISGFTAELADDIAFTYLNTYGNFGLIDNGGDNSYSHAMVLTVGLTDNLQYIAQSDNLRTDNTDTDSYGLNQYLIYKFNDVVSVGGRMEWWKLNGVSYYEATGGLNVQVLSNLVIRPEYRQDWAPSNNAVNGSAPGGAGSIDEDTFLVDAILTF